jgi:hypothetical protein
MHHSKQSLRAGQKGPGAWAAKAWWLPRCQPPRHGGDSPAWSQRGPAPPDGYLLRALGIMKKLIGAMLTFDSRVVRRVRYG